MKPIQVGELSRSPTTSVIDLPFDEVRELVEAQDEGFDSLEQLSGIFTEEFGSLIDDRLIQVYSNEFWLQIEVQDSIYSPLAVLSQAPRPRRSLRALRISCKIGNIPFK